MKNKTIAMLNSMLSELCRRQAQDCETDFERAELQEEIDELTDVIEYLEKTLR